MKSKMFFVFSKINYFNNKNGLIVYLLILLGVLIPALSGTPTTNFWYRMYSIQNSPFFNLMFFLSLGFIVVFTKVELSKNYNFIIRYKNYKNLINHYIYDIISISIYYSIVSFILIIAGSVFLSFGNFELLQHSFYDLSLLYYVVFFAIRSAIIASIINSIIFLLLTTLKKYFLMCTLILNSILFFIIPTFQNIIMHFYNMPLLPHYYFTQTYYSSFYLEIICSILEVLLLLAIYKILYNFFIKRKREWA